MAPEDPRTQDNPPESEALERIRHARIGKVARLEAAGPRGYPARFPRSHLAEEVRDRYEELAGQRVSVAGRLGVFKSFGKLAFVFLHDNSGQVQLLLRPRDLTGDAAVTYEALDSGDFVGATGTVTRTRTGEVSVEVEPAGLTLLSKALRNLPEKWHGIADVEIRYRQRYLDLLSNPEARRVFLTRGKIIASIRRFLDERGFVEVETPVLQPIAGGGAARPFATRSNALDTTLYLRIALELYLKRLIVGGIERVYEIGKNFRNEGVSFKHNPEFTMLELYQAYADYGDIMQLTEEMVAHAAQAATGTMRLPRGADGTVDFTPPWRRVPLREAVAEYSGVDYNQYPDAESLRAAAAKAGLHPEPTWNRGKTMDELLTAFVEPKLQDPTFLVDYPADFPGSTLAKGKPNNPSEVERFEAFAGGMEIANAFSELNDPRVQRERFEAQARARQAGDEEAQPYDADFLVALEHGMPPTGGLGVGIDRITMLITNQHSIRDVILFPQMRPRD